MTFLQPILLAGLPLVALPILIHLINRQRHRTIRWAAMMFLLDAQRMTRGMARLRHWLILAMRVLAIAALVIAIARPLASGWLGLAVGGQPDTTILVLDRSASMEQRDLQTGQSKRTTGLRKLSQLAKTFGTNTRIVLIENTENRALSLDSADSLMDIPQTSATSTSADIPAMLQTALDYVVANQTGRTDIWICSDLRESDWRPDDGRWTALRQGFERFEGVRFYLLSYPEKTDDNVAVWVTNVRRRQVGRTVELVLDVGLQRESVPKPPIQVPIEFVINGARSVLTIEMSDSEHNLQGHTIALDANTTSGWGRVELPTDTNPQDNVYYFVFAEPPEHRTVIVSDDTRVAELVRLAATSPADPGLSYEATVLASDRADEIPWDETSLIVWQASLPDGIIAQQMRHFVDRGRPILFFPPDDVGTNQMFGVRWGEWRKSDDQGISVTFWRADSDLLRHAESGAALPLGKLRTHQYCPPQGSGSVLARLEGGEPLLIRVTTDGGPVYFCSTLPHAEYSSLAREGVVFYVMIQRALSAGAATQSPARQVAAGSPEAAQVSDWQALSESSTDRLRSTWPVQAGAFQNGDQLIGLNRPENDDDTRTLDRVAVDRLFRGLDYRQVQDQVGSASALASEIWRAFLCAMAVALLVEAWLCLPERKVPQVA